MGNLISYKKRFVKNTLIITQAITIIHAHFSSRLPLIFVQSIVHYCTFQMTIQASGNCNNLTFTSVNNLKNNIQQFHWNDLSGTFLPHIHNGIYAYWPRKIWRYNRELNLIPGNLNVTSQNHVSLNNLHDPVETAYRERCKIYFNSWTFECISGDIVWLSNVPQKIIVYDTLMANSSFSFRMICF